MKKEFGSRELGWVGVRMGLIAAAGLIVSACSQDGHEPTAPIVSNSQVVPEVQGARWKSHDEVLEAIATRIPGFAGLYIDSTGIVVNLSGPTVGHAVAEAAIRPILSAARASGHLELSQAAAAPMRFGQAEFRFAQLLAWKRALYRKSIPRGTVLVGIDSRSNRLIVTTSGPAARSGWESKVAAEKVDANAVRFDYMDPPQPNGGLRDSAVSPTAGGLQVVYNGASCTLGANVSLAWVPGNYFITASHCSNDMWGVDQVTSTWYQPAFPRSVAVGDDTDPGPFTGSGCPTGMACRWSDATLVRYTGDSIGLVGRITRATSAPSQNSTPPSILYFQQYGWPNCWICPATQPYKTGRTTGTTIFSANYYSADFYPDSATYAAVGVTIGGNWVILSQTYHYSGIAAGGDSGSPVFQYDAVSPENNPLIVGIYHAGSNPFGNGNRIVSPMAGVANDLAGGYFNLVFY